MDKSVTIEGLMLLFSRKKVEALVVYHVILCFAAISLRFWPWWVTLWTELKAWRRPPSLCL